MFFSVKEYHAAMVRLHNPITKKLAADRLREVKRAIVDRKLYAGTTYVGKWLRPWTVVPKLCDFIPNDGDFGVGVEVEYGFIGINAARTIANKIKNWRYITLDWEGGEYPIEVTFPPVLLSKLSKKSQVLRYIALLNDNKRLLHKHRPSALVGTHVCVSHRGRLDRDRCLAVNNLLNGLRRGQAIKYFGRVPYGYGYNRAKFVEWKLFDSTTDVEVVKRYINIAVALTDLVYATDVPINAQTVGEALEYGYNRKGFGKWKSLYNNNTAAVAA